MVEYYAICDKEKTDKWEDCLCELWEKFQNGKFDEHDEVNTDLINLNNNMIIPFMEDAYELAGKISGEEEDPQISENWCTNFHKAVKKLNEEICDFYESDHIEDIKALNNLFQEIRNQANYIKDTIEEDLGMEVCIESDEEDETDIEFRFEVCKDRSALFSCLCRLFDVEYHDLNTEAQNKLDDFYENEFLPFFNELSNAVDNINNGNGEDNGGGHNPGEEPKCPEFLEAGQMLRKLCQNEDQVDGETKQDLIDTIDAFENAFEELKNDLQEYGVEYVCSDGNPYARQYQSNQLYLQATGSDGSDDTSEGVHLRWSFRNHLGTNHLPKGNLINENSNYNTDILYNKSDDYVSIYRVPYTDFPYFEINLEDGPDALDTEDVVTWKYYQKGVHQQRILKVYFHNKSMYNSISGQPYEDILKNYNGVIEIEWADNMVYAVSFVFRKNDENDENAQLEWEILSSEDKSELSSQHVACRQVLNLDSDTYEDSRFRFCENISSVKFRSEKGYVPTIKLNSYKEFIDSKWFDWYKLGEFSLTEDDNEALNRLEDTNRFEVNNKWPRFNDGTRVNIDNYQTQWSQNNGLKNGVQRYLELSTTDALATENLSSETPGDQSVIEMSNLKMLQLASLDYHVARMLGLGYIDEMPQSSDDNDRYVYLAKYEMKGSMAGGTDSYTQPHYFMSLPTARTDHRLPLSPKQPETDFGLRNSELNNRMFDENGYSKFHRVRAINIKRKKFDYENAGSSFFAYNTEFCTCGKTIPALFGIEYKEKNAQSYVKPEITNIVSEDAQMANELLSHDDNLGSVRQTHPVLDNLNALFLHKERNEGEHVYALYGINWFSRVSQVGPEKQVETIFPQIRRPMQPLNFSVQYIQHENTLLFTSKSERTELENRKLDSNINDPWFTRVSFIWSHLHNDQYPETEKVSFYFRKNLLKEVKGEVYETDDHQDDDKLIIKTGVIDSFEQTNDIEPYIDPAESHLFEGGYLKSGGQFFQVISIQNSGNLPEIVIQGIRRENLVQASDGSDIINSQMIFPEQGKKFSLMENFNNTDGWTKLEKEVGLVHFTANDVDPAYDPYYFEESVDEDGNKTVLNAKGIYDKTTIEDKSGDHYAGIYKIEYDDKKLDDHPDNGVEWYGGIARIPVDNNEAPMREVEVLKIENKDPVTLWVFDPAYEDSSKDKLKTGSDLYVNFHPGYRVYIYNEDEPELQHSELYPDEGEKQNKLLMAARSEDDGLYSDFSNPAVLLIREIIKPEKPEKPTGPTFATRPDYYGKASFTFDTEVNVNGRKPFGFIFYRATDKGFLNKLYNKDTLEEEVWPLLKNDEFINDRLNSLVNAELENNEPKEFDGEKLPLPDVADPNDTESENIKAIDEAVAKAFAPLTERPPLYDFIEEGYQTQNETPQVKDPATGRFIEPSSPEFNPFPFIRKFTNDQGKRIIRFTDYTLDGASQDLVFYRVKEMNDEMEMSEPGDTIGPITLINSMPPEKPQIKKVESVAENPALNRAAGIRFNVEPYLKRDNVEHVRVYRTQNADKLPHVRLMEYAGDYPVNNIKDDFSDRDFPPFGEPVFYRLVALRKIQSDYTDNQDNPLEEFVPSQPSGPVVANVIDAVNPPAPEIVLKGFDWGNSVVNDVELQWNKTTHNGKYHLYKMSNAGNWQKIHTLATNDAPIVVDLANTELGTNQLTVEDQQGRPVYHHFKVVAENASGLLSKEENIWTIGGNNAEQAFFENYKTYVENNDGNIYNESQTINTFNETGADEEAAIFAAFSGIKLEPGNKLHQWFNHNLQGTHMETSDPENRAEWTDIFRGIARVAIEKPTENKILTPDQCGNESSDWILAGASAEPASSFFSDFDAWKIINNGTTSHRTAQAFNISAHGKVTFSAVVEKGTAEACRLRIWDGSVQGRFSFDLVNGQQLNTSGEHVEFRKLANNGPNGVEVWLLAVTAEVNSTSITTDLWPDENGDEGHTFVHFTQLEESKYFTLPVEEVRSAAAPVLPDFLPSEDGSGEGTLYFWVDFVNDPDQPLHLLEADGNNNLSLKLNNNGAVELKWYDGNPHSNVLGGILPSDYKRAIRFIAITWDSASQLHLYWGDSEGNFQKTDTLTFNSTSINTQNIRPGQSENGNDQTSVMFHFLKADNQFRDDNAIEQLYHNLRQIIF